MILSKRYNSIVLLIALMLCCCCASTHAAQIAARAQPTDVASTSLEAVYEASEQTQAVQPTNDTTALSVLGMVRGLWNWLKEDLRESLYGDDSSTAEAAAANSVTGRTFGKIRRLQMAIIPLIFKLGLLTAMVGFLVLLGMKTLFLVKLLVLMNAAIILAKFLTLKSNFGAYEHAAPAPAPVWGYSNWSPHAQSGWAETAPVQPAGKEIHLHIHGAQPHSQVSGYSTYGTGAHQQQQHGWERRYDPYAAYEPAPVLDMGAQQEWSNTAPKSLVSAKYPANHRSF